MWSYGGLPYPGLFLSSSECSADMVQLDTGCAGQYKVLSLDKKEREGGIFQREREGEKWLLIAVKFKLEAQHNFNSQCSAKAYDACVNEGVNVAEHNPTIPLKGWPIRQWGGDCVSYYITFVFSCSYSQHIPQPLWQVKLYYTYQCWNIHVHRQ